ncbi:MAG: dTDP-glucose 4,6-dehydratase [Planctomycetota bacterium]
MRVLVTGGCGFIGSALVRLILADRSELSVINLDALTYAGRLENLVDVADSDRYEFIRGDVRDENAVASLVARCDAVLHLAAESHVDRSIDSARVFFETNTVGTQVVLEAARRTDFGGPIVIVSTDEVYGDAPADSATHFDEDAVLRPSSPYAASKAAADLAALAMHRTFGLDVRIVRGSNSYGPRQYPEKIIPRFVTNLIRGERVPLYGDGSAMRDWLHVDDHARAILAVLDRGKAGRVYNASAGNERTNLELTRLILGELGQDDAMIERVADRPGHDRRYPLDSSRIAAELGWSPKAAWPEALAETVRWYAEHGDWWEHLGSP